MGRFGCGYASWVVKRELLPRGACFPGPRFIKRSFAFRSELRLLLDALLLVGGKAVLICEVYVFSDEARCGGAGTPPRELRFPDSGDCLRELPAYMKTKTANCTNTDR